MCGQSGMPGPVVNSYRPNYIGGAASCENPEPVARPSVYVRTLHMNDLNDHDAEFAQRVRVAAIRRDWTQDAT
jgi:hypothetical protein